MFPKPFIVGSFQDCEGNPLANGMLQFRLLSDAQSTSGQITSGQIVSMSLDAGGSISGSPTIWANSSLQTGSGTNMYEVIAYSAAGQPVWSSTAVVNNLLATYNISSIIPNGVYGY